MSLRRFATFVCAGLAALALGTAAQTAFAQTKVTAVPELEQKMLPNIQGTYRGGSNVVGSGCTLGAERCQVGLRLDFAMTSTGQLQVTFYRGAGTAFYEAMKDGMPYAKEDKMESRGTLPVVVAQNGTFSFSYDYDGDVYHFDKCRLPQAGALQCYFRKKLGSSKIWVNLYQR